MLSRPRKDVDAAWAAYRESGENGKQWKWTVKQVRERFGYQKDTLYRDFDRSGHTERRKPLRTRRKRKTQDPPCPAVGRYCVFCDLMPFCTDWHCQSCDKYEMCPCCQPKSQQWLGAWWAWEIESENEDKLYDVLRAACNILAEKEEEYAD